MGAEKDLIQEKLLSLARCIDRIISHQPTSASELKNNFDAQDIISVNLQRAVQLSVDIGGFILSKRKVKAPGSMAEIFASLNREGIIATALSDRLQRAVGFRNISVHEYDEIDWSIVYDVVINHLDDFRAFATAINSAL
jgi:uncharacterized protein YutE (UPF0331/DUF86 family)